MSLRHITTVFATSALLMACTASAPSSDTITLTEHWVLDGFDAPESVIKTATGDGYYVSNVGGDGTDRDNNGAIALISVDGVMVNRSWAMGTEERPLHAPKGMALIGNQLAVTDIDHIVLIDLASGQIADRIAIAGSAFLNDAAAGPNGTILVSDSGTARIYSLENGIPSLWLEDPRLSGVNGLQLNGDHLLVTTMSEGELLSIDWATKEITSLASGMANADGIGLRSDNSVIISSWPGQLWHVRNGQTPRLLQDTSGDDPTLMNDILLVDDSTLVTPNWIPGTVRAYSISN